MEKRFLDELLEATDGAYGGSRIIRLAAEVGERREKEFKDEIARLKADNNEKILKAVGEIKSMLESSVQIWTCGCGHTNGVNLARCAVCERRPNGERD